MATKTRKFDYLYVVQGDYGAGWEDTFASLDYREARSNLRAYRENAPEYPARLIRRREISEAWEG